MGIFHGIFHSFLYVYQRVAINPYQSYPAANTKMGDFIRVKKSVLELEDLLKLQALSPQGDGGTPVQGEARKAI